ncbi:DMT family transporter [Lactococcus lactis]|uniref:DMT family transporter n=1 Tax=Lactococcus lactis TaxID=1358 RepID=UPI000E496B31|nr:DMT family transporter [Lactococcus lactis]RHJ27565.1 DMT family transporter [Lactococcus lactis]USI48384.1 DMT family transporter [Lactococcus lactis]
MNSIDNKTRAKWLMISVSFVWGASYLLMKVALIELQPLDVLSWRFIIAFVILFCIFFKNASNIDLKILLKSTILGSLLFLLYFCLIIGVGKTSASNAGFLSSSTVIIVPIIDSIIKKYIPSKKTIISIIVVFIGLFLLIVKNNFSFDGGTIYCLGAAFFYAVYIICSDILNNSNSKLEISIWQLGITGLISILFSISQKGTINIPHSFDTWLVVIFLAVLCTSYSFIAQSRAQLYLKPELIGLIFSLEPIFSAFLSLIFLHEILSFKSYLGAFLILLGILYSQYNFKKFTK